VAAGRERGPRPRRVSLPGVAELLRPVGPGPATDSGRQASGREAHPQKITVYLSADEFLDLERARLSLHIRGIRVDRGRLVREAIAVLMADLEAGIDASLIARRLRAVGQSVPAAEVPAAEVPAAEVPAIAVPAIAVPAGAAPSPAVPGAAAPADGVQAAGAATNGGSANTVLANGALADGARVDGARVGGARVGGARADGAGADGVAAVGASVTGATVDGVPADDACDASLNGDPVTNTGAGGGPAGPQ
jgi:hypothetical protein